MNQLPTFYYVNGNKILLQIMYDDNKRHNRRQFVLQKWRWRPAEWAFLFLPSSFLLFLFLFDNNRSFSFRSFQRPKCDTVKRVNSRSCRRKAAQPIDLPEFSFTRTQMCKRESNATQSAIRRRWKRPCSCWCWCCTGVACSTLEIVGYLLPMPMSTCYNNLMMLF